MPEVIHQDGRGKQVINRHVEVALKLAGVQVKRQHAVHTGGGDQVSHQLCRNGHPGPVLAVLPPIAEIRDHGRDARCRRPPAGIGHDQQFHKMVVDRIARRLHQENVLPAYILLDLDEDLPVAEVRHLDTPGIDSQVIAYSAGQSRIGAPREKPQVFQFFTPWRDGCSASALINAVGSVKQEG